MLSINIALPKKIHFNKGVPKPPKLPQLQESPKKFSIWQTLKKIKEFTTLQT